MAGRYARVLRRQVALDDVEIGPAYATGADAQQHVARPCLRIFDLGDLQRAFGNRSR
jgi:hypothetical protein